MKGEPRIPQGTFACARESALGHSRFVVDLFGSGFAGLGYISCNRIHQGSIGFSL